MLSGAIDPIDLDIQAIVREELSPTARSAALADAAREALTEAEKQDTVALGFAPPHTTMVDGTVGANENGVRPDGVIEYSFSLLPDIFSWISDHLRQFAPVGTGRDPHPGQFRDSFEFYADKALADVNNPPMSAAEYVFLSNVPYAKKIEEGQSNQAPSGVFEAVATLAQQQFGNQALIRFSFRAPEQGQILAYVPLGRIWLRHRGRFIQSQSTGNQAAADHERDLRVPAITVSLRT